MNKWNEIIKPYIEQIEQIEKDEENAKKMVEIRTDVVTIVNKKEIDYIIEYASTILSVLNITTNYDIKERMKSLIKLLEALKE